MTQQFRASANREDLTKLLVLVALLISTTGFRNELERVRLGDTSITLFNVFTWASIAFGTLLYLHLMWDAHLLLLKAWIDRGKSKLLLVLRFVFVAILWLIPAFTACILFANWLNQPLCFVPVDMFLLNPLADSGTPNATPETCPTILAGTILPIVLSILTVWILNRFVTRHERNIPPELRGLSADINIAKLMLALSDGTEKADAWERELEKLKVEYMRISKKLKADNHPKKR